MSHLRPPIWRAARASARARKAWRAQPRLARRRVTRLALSGSGLPCVVVPPRGDRAGAALGRRERAHAHDDADRGRLDAGLHGDGVAPAGDGGRPVELKLCTTSHRSRELTETRQRASGLAHPEPITAAAPSHARRTRPLRPAGLPTAAWPTPRAAATQAAHHRPYQTCRFRSRTLARPAAVRGHLRRADARGSYTALRRPTTRKLFTRHCSTFSAHCERESWPIARRWIPPLSVSYSVPQPRVWVWVSMARVAE